MATVATIVTRVQEIVQDTSLATDNTVMRTLNEQIPAEITSRITLPGLMAVADVLTVPSVPFQPLPVNYSRGLHYALNATTRRLVRIETFPSKYFDTYPLEDSVGSVQTVMAYQGNLRYQPSPATPERLRLRYIRKMADITATNQWPDGFPEFAPVDMFAYLVAWKLFELIEDGVSSAKTNSAENEARFRRKRAEFETMILNGDTDTFGGFSA